MAAGLDPLRRGEDNALTNSQDGAPFGVRGNLSLCDHGLARCHRFCLLSCIGLADPQTAVGETIASVIAVVVWSSARTFSFRCRWTR